MVNDQTANALDALRSQILQAEAVLQRIPGARHDECCVLVCQDSDMYLYYGEVDGEMCIYKANPYRRTMTPLLELPLVERIEAAALIPHLIEDAETCESAIAKEAAEAAETLEQYLAIRAESSD